jgi:hypothetical protein
MLRCPGRWIKCYSLTLQKLFEKERGRVSGVAGACENERSKGEKTGTKMGFTHSRNVQVWRPGVHIYFPASVVLRPNDFWV